MTAYKLKVLIVDDTLLYRRILTEVVDTIGNAEVVAVAAHGRLALTKLSQTTVDLVLLDVEMPEMNGLETLKEIRKRYPAIAVIMVSGVNEDSAKITMEALEQGALDFVSKPKGDSPEANLNELVSTLRPLFNLFLTRRNLRHGSGETISPPPDSVQLAPPAVIKADSVLPDTTASSVHPQKIDVIAIGISTGGPNALGVLIPALPSSLNVPVLLVQHMPPLFTASLAAQLAKKSTLTVREAVEGDLIEKNTVYIAPGGSHMTVCRATPGAPLMIGTNTNPPENNCRPSVDVLFRSVTAHYGANVLAVVMTGMGTDGREGVRFMKRKGCICVTQSAESCVVYGMPQAVDEAGLSDKQVPLDSMAEYITKLVKNPQGI